MWAISVKYHSLETENSLQSAAVVDLLAMPAEHTSLAGAHQNASPSPVFLTPGFYIVFTIGVLVTLQELRGMPETYG